MTDLRGVADLARIVLAQLSGQRVIPKEYLEGAPMDDARYGVEVAINRHLEEMNIRVTEVELFNISQVMKEEKYGVIEGMKKRANMYYEVFKTMFTG